MPKFFVPAANDDDQAESVRAGVIKFMVDQGFQDITTRRIFKLAYRHDSQDHFQLTSDDGSRAAAKAGPREPLRWPREGEDAVKAETDLPAQRD